MSIMPITVDESKVSAVVNPLDPAELFVDPGAQGVDLPSLRHLIPAEWRDAPVHRFEPTSGGHGGAWVLRTDLPTDHIVRVWGTDTYWCICTACDAYRAARLDLVLPAAVDDFLAEALGE